MKAYMNKKSATPSCQISSQQLRRGSMGMVATVMVAILLAFSLVSSGQAEVRSYLQLDTRLLPASKLKQALKLDVFVKEESRYRREGLVLNKLSLGFRPTFNPWLKAQVYYAHKDMDYTRRLTKHMLVGDVILSARSGTFSLKDRSGNEWHITDRFYRYRNYLELALKTPIHRFTVWTAEEWRFDSDQSRVNMNDVRLGLSMHLPGNLNSKIFYDFESNRRHCEHWQDNSFMGLALTASL